MKENFAMIMVTLFQWFENINTIKIIQFGSKEKIKEIKKHSHVIMVKSDIFNLMTTLSPVLNFFLNKTFLTFCPDFKTIPK